jgi:hypothetical protein
MAGCLSASRQTRDRAPGSRAVDASFLYGHEGATKWPHQRVARWTC